MGAILLSGCVQTDAKGHPYGIVYDYLAKPAQFLLSWLAQHVGGYGWAIICLTIIVRTVLLPLMIVQIKKSTLQQEKMLLLKPALSELQELQKKATTNNQRLILRQQMTELYKDNGISLTGGIGCLPLLIQTPVFIGLYAAIRYSPELAHTEFLGIQLGQSSWILAVLSFLAYLLQGYLSTLGVPESQKSQMRLMMLMSPIFILFITLTSPAGLGLYFFIGGLFACLQTVIINLYRPKIKRSVEEQTKKHPIKTNIPKDIREEIENGEKQSNIKSKSKPSFKNQKNKKRNAGKQQHHHKKSD